MFFCLYLRGNLRVLSPNASLYVNSTCVHLRLLAVQFGQGSENGIKVVFYWDQPFHSQPVWVDTVDISRWNTLIMTQHIDSRQSTNPSPTSKSRASCTKNYAFCSVGSVGITVKPSNTFWCTHLGIVE